MLTHREGKPGPQVTFHTREGNEWKDPTTEELFRGRDLVVFALPGAFTPTCSSTHLPRYNELAPVFRENGIDEVICMPVNDGFVMNAWAQDQQADSIRFIPDGNGDFAEGMRMLVDKDELGFGRRSCRYSMLVRDGVIEKMFIEPEEPGDPFRVSDADTMLRYLNNSARLPRRVTLFTNPGCPHCSRAKKMLGEAGYRFEEIEPGNGGLSYTTLARILHQTTRMVEGKCDDTGFSEVFRHVVDGDLYVCHALRLVWSSSGAQAPSTVVPATISVASTPDDDHPRLEVHGIWCNIRASGGDRCRHDATSVY